MLISSVLANGDGTVVKGIKLQMQNTATLGQLTFACHIQADLSVIQRPDENKCHGVQDPLVPLGSCHNFIVMIWCYLKTTHGGLSCHWPVINL